MVRRNVSLEACSWIQLSIDWYKLYYNYYIFMQYTAIQHYTINNKKKKSYHLLIPNRVPWGSKVRYHMRKCTTGSLNHHWDIPKTFWLAYTEQEHYVITPRAHANGHSSTSSSFRRVMWSKAWGSRHRRPIDPAGSGTSSSTPWRSGWGMGVGGVGGHHLSPSPDPGLPILHGHILHRPSDWIQCQQQWDVLGAIHNDSSPSCWR